ncbi:MAG: SCO family protein [Rhizobiaceae bacterium]|nr:SCO family protein [Rhizobiaceae bacterium]
MKMFRVVTWSLCVALISLMVFVWSQSNDEPVTGLADIGGEFSMMSAQGKTITEKSFPGKAKMYFLGFTHCPDICPTTLSDISNWLKQLEADADKLQPIFVTADPERDTTKILK